MGDTEETTDEQPVERAVKFVGPDTIEGLAMPFGRDTDGESFTADTDLCVEWFGKSGRPVLYNHGLDRAMKAQRVGRQMDFEVREEGIWAQSQLDANARYRKAIDALIEQGALGYSSGAMPHLATKNRRGELTRWPWVELSLTPYPAHPGTLGVHYVKSADLLALLEDSDHLSVAAVKALAAELGTETATPDPESLDEKAGRVSAAIDEFRDHARGTAEMRVKAGRVLSNANRERIAKALASRESVMAAYADLEALLSETDPEAAAKSASALVDAVLEAEATLARSFGVALPT